LFIANLMLAAIPSPRTPPLRLRIVVFADSIGQDIAGEYCSVACA
jgi:hypothetical protein